MSSTDRAIAAPAPRSRLLHRIHHGTRKPANWMQLLRFGLVGVSGYVVNLAAFAAAVINNFAWNRHWTFDAGDGHAGFQAARFFTVSVIGLGINLALLELFVTGAGLPELPAQALAVALTMPVNFVGNKLWTFDG